MQGLLAGLLVLSVTYFGGKGLLQRFFFRTGYVYAEETERAEELQEYVTQNKLSASDYKMLKKWGTERNISLTFKKYPHSFSNCCIIFYNQNMIIHFHPFVFYSNSIK